jgi:hypothetical protein
MERRQQQGRYLCRDRGHPARSACAEPRTSAPTGFCSRSACVRVQGSLPGPAGRERCPYTNVTAVNGVKAPYAGLPAPTVALIERGEGTMLVDWVRVTRP